MMKNHYRILLAALLLTAGMPAHATDWQETTDIVWAGRNYQEFNGLASNFSESDAAIRWTFAPGTIVTYVVHLPSGHVRADVVLQNQAGKIVTLNVRVLYPKTNTTIIEHTVQSRTGTGKQSVEILPDTELTDDGWYRFEFTSPDAHENMEQMHYLSFQREAQQVATAANSQMAPAVHLWWSSTDPKCPNTDSFDWIYTEALIPEAHKQSCTYQMTIGSTGLYSGIQTNHVLSNDTWTHAVIFSAWDNGDTDVDKTLPDYLRSGAVDLGEEAYAVRFGGEGTGASLRYPEGQRWQTDHWVQMLMFERPDYIETISTDEQGNTVRKPFRSTLLSYWYKQAEETQWHYFGTLRAANTYRMEGNRSGLYSFLENWSGFGGDRYRRVYFRNGSFRSTATGQWYSLNHAGFSSTQKEGQRNSRDDYGHGVTEAYEHSFYIESGGQLGVRDSANTYEPLPQGEMPWVDTINLDALRARVHQGMQKVGRKDINMRIEATSVISDPTRWQLIAFSDEETNSEGDYGRAAQIMDGNTSSYYRQKDYSNFPHTFTFDAGETVTVKSIGLYQSMDLNYRAKQMQLFISEDGSSFTSVERLTFDNDEAPTACLSEPVTARYFRCRFISGYGAGNCLAINEMYFKDEYHLADMKALAEELLAEEEHFGGYSAEDLAELKAVYDNGNIADVEALRTAIASLGQRAQPLAWGNVDKTAHITAFTAYQLHNPYGYGDLVVNEDGKLAVAGACVEGALETYQRATRISSPADNWLILRSDTYDEYYIYNLGSRQYLNVTTDGITVSQMPQALDFTTRSDGFTLGQRRARLQLHPESEEVAVRTSRVDEACVLQLRNNYVHSPADTEVRRLLAESEELLHGGTGDGIVQPQSEALTQADREVAVFNLQGIKVWQGRDDSQPQLPSGIYIMKSGNLFAKKLVKR